MNASDEDDSMLGPPLILDQQESDNDEQQEQQDVTESHADQVELVECIDTQKVRVDLKRPRAHEAGDDEGDTCPICLEMWADAGEHRLCAMRCGHLFGRSCIEMWLRNNRNCPSCKKRGYKRELRNIFCTKVVALEESAVLDLKSRVQCMERNECALRDTISAHVLQHEQLSAQVATLQQRLQVARALLDTNVAHGTERVSAAGDSVDGWFRRLVRLCSVPISLEGGCRVMDHDACLNAIVCSMKCPNAMFGSYGLAKLDMTTFQTMGNIPLHAAPIRDVRFQSAGGSSLLLTASMDKHARLIDTRAAGVARTYAPILGARASPLWTCCWGDPGAMGGSYTLFVGEQQGDIVELDMRRLTEPVSTMSVEGDRSPVVSLQMLPAVAGVTCFPGGALVACRLTSLRVFERAHGAYKLRTLRDTLQGPFISMSIDKGDRGLAMGAGAGGRHLLVSTRPNSAYAWSRHMYGQFVDAGDDTLTFQPVHTFAGGAAASLLSRNCVTSKCACAYMETTRSVSTWSLATGKMLPSHPVQLPILDVAMFGGDHLMALDERRLDVFRME